MEPATLIAGASALVFAILAMLQWRRATDLEARLRALEAELADLRSARLAPELAPAPPVEPPLEPEPPDATPLEPAVAEPPAELEALPEPPAVEPGDDPASARRSLEPGGEPESLRLEALKVVAEAFETARYLDFEFIVQKPSTYRVSVPLTAANGRAVRHLEEGMFPCLKQVRIEDGKAVLHIDTAQGPP